MTAIRITTLLPSCQSPFSDTVLISECRLERSRGGNREIYFAGDISLVALKKPRACLILEQRGGADMF
jgi:hypothetical protein